MAAIGQMLESCRKSSFSACICTLRMALRSPLWCSSKEGFQMDSAFRVTEPEIQNVGRCRFAEEVELEARMAAVGHAIDQIGHGPAGYPTFLCFQARLFGIWCVRVEYKPQPTGYPTFLCFQRAASPCAASSGSSMLVLRALWSNMHRFGSWDVSM